MIYTTKEYSQVFYSGTKSVRTIERMVQFGKLPSNHKIKRTKRCIMIEIQGDDEAVSGYFNASVEFQERKKQPSCETKEDIWALAAELSVKYQLKATIFFKMHGL